MPAAPGLLARNHPAGIIPRCFGAAMELPQSARYALRKPPRGGAASGPAKPVPWPLLALGHGTRVERPVVEVA
ncbi:hypothetical protein GCM10007320_04410 [Pseudorhodoferax aquiterrae]|uniref:Uncharacterized protein n=1 Tax=Pseudorhodoferax aquiterrae TaxID=747304 RepID=A0ABQ3FWM7_9BURK|nr:hypothetical protein GCM10007320_04410 [Pseudorhodoferax aquiterrae]